MTKDHQGLIEQYLTHIYDENQSKGIYNGREIDCTSRTGALLLANQLIEQEKKVRQGFQSELPRRETLGYAGEGMFGIVFIKRVGRGGMSENLFACKIIESDDLQQKLANEVGYQRLAAQHKIAPLIYDYYLYKCEDGKTRGVIIMQFLNNYVKGYEFEPMIEKTYPRHLYQASGFTWPGAAIIRKVESNLN